MAPNTPQPHSKYLPYHGVPRKIPMWDTGAYDNTMKFAILRFCDFDIKMLWGIFLFFLKSFNRFDQPIVSAFNGGNIHTPTKVLRTRIAKCYLPKSAETQFMSVMQIVRG
eukprot:2734507-Rhodomonas_salina.2